MAIDIRQVPEAELRGWVDIIETAFGEEMREERWLEYRRVLVAERTLGAYDGERIVGGAADYLFRLTIPGGAQLAAAGVTSVGVLPTHRRRGILNQLMRRQLAEIRGRGEPLAILTASEGSIYQRYGYGLATLNASIDIERERAVMRSPLPVRGNVRLVDATEAARTFPPVYDVLRRATPGFFDRDATWWEVHPLSDSEHQRRGRSRKFYALYERDGAVRGYALYRIKQEWGDVGSRSALQVQEVMALDPLAGEELWRYLFGVDLIERIQSSLGPPDHPLMLTLAEPRRLRLRLGDGLWLRLLDVPAALAARGYGADGQLVLDVTDELLPDVGGRWRLAVEDGLVSVEASDQAPDLALDITDLGAVYLGGFSFAQLALAGRTQELTPAAHSIADRLFGTYVRPWCPEIF